MMKLVFIRPPTEENEVRAASVVDANKAHTVISFIRRDEVCLHKPRDTDKRDDEHRDE